MTTITRRHLIGGLATIPAFVPGAASAASEAPVHVPNPQPPPAAAPACLTTETPLAKINRLATELAEALEQWSAGHRNTWHIVVPRASVGRGWYTLNEAPSYRRDGRVV